MYAWLWRRFPGPLPARLVLTLLLLVGVVALLFLVVFPAVDVRLHLNEVTVER